MSLRSKIIYSLLVVGIVFLVCFYVISNTVLLNGFIQIEDEQNFRNIERLNELISDELVTLTTTSVAWSSWDDSFNYVLNPSDKFTKKNYIIDTMFESKFSRIMYFNLKGDLLFTQDYDFLNRTFITTNPVVIDEFQNNIIKKIVSQEFKKPTTGFLKINDKLEYFSLNPILPNSGLGQHIGYLAIFRGLDQSAIEKFKRILKLDLNLDYLNILPTQTTFTKFNKLHEKVLAEVGIQDYLQRGYLRFTIDMPRRIFLHGESTLSRFITIFLFFIFVCCLISYYIFDKLITQRILKLKSELKNISKENSSSARVESKDSDEIGQLAHDINITLDSLENKQFIITRTSKLSALGEIAASIAHEINNPLTVIFGYSFSISKNISEGLNQEEIDKNEVLNKLKIILINIQRIDKIIKSLRFFSRDGDNDDLVLIRIGDILDDVKTLCSESIKSHDITLNVEEFQSDLMIMCRPVQIAQVLLNLFNNSIEALENTSDAWIKISTFETSENMILSFTDNGPQISEKIVTKLMDPFFTTKPPGKGTGLGLSISKKILESHGGKLILHTKPHTCFQMIFQKKLSKEL